MNITIAEIIDGKYPKVKTADGKSFNVASASAFEQGKTYTIEYAEKPVQWQGKSFKAKEITKATLVNGSAPTTNGNGKYTPEDKEAFARKDLIMARMCALKASVEMVKAEVERGDTLGVALSEMQRTYYAEFLAEITK